MPIIPAVFQSVRSNDVQNRPFYAYKHYTLTDEDWTTGSGHNRHVGIYKKHTPHVGDDSYNYPENSDNTNKHVVWNVIDHRYYRHPYDPARSHELTDARTVTKHLSYSASTLTIPYMDVGEKIKPGSVRVSSSFDTMAYILQDDENGNLRDILISTSSFATSSRNVFYMSFNKEFEQLEYVNGNWYGGGPIGTSKDNFTYSLTNIEKYAKNENVKIVHGVMTSGRINKPTGFGAYFSGSNSYIRVPHNNTFDRFNKFDDWTIAFWYRRQTNDGLTKPILSKLGVSTQLYYDRKHKQQKIRSVANKRLAHRGVTGNNKDQRFPFLVGVTNNISNSSSFSFQASDGSRLFHISASSRSTTGSLYTDWDHVLIRNSSSICEMFVNGTKSSESGSLPPQPTANGADVMIGSPYTESINKGYPMGLNNDSLSELRMYDYAVNDTGITSLLNRNYSSGSLYQTNVAGNVFYRNGQVVVSSPMPIYNTGSGAFENPFHVAYRGTHKIYENQVFVRVPKDQFNVSMNPTATYTPPTVGFDIDESNILPGELRKSMFISGTAYPYITSIGLYNDKCQMIATAKLAQPIQKRDDVDMNFVVRWDY